ncbi:MAG TPA: PCRF domain-containing protein [Tepidisphaeraceae bacterium]|nr:PCRF domain-containing protein [Tepidisphaeraceae bacterium]
MTETDLSIPAALSRKLDESAARFDELQRQLNDPDVLSSPAKLVPITKESGRLETLVARYRSLLKAIDGVKELQAMAAGDDAEMASMASDDLPGASAAALEQLEALKDEFVAAEDNKVDSFFLEIRAGTGGEEAALFGRDLYEMYRKYCEVNRWHFDTSDYSVSERGGFKEVIVNIKGTGAYRHMQFEGGGHRVQRVPETEAQGRIHTSAATVAVVPEMPDVQIDINPKDVEEFGCRGGGPGGQNVNKVETGWFIRHKPSGVSFKMTEHKSQTQNKERAWALLRAMLYETERAKQHAEVTGLRKSQMGSGDRSQRIRTYNFPQNRCTDHRLGGEGGGEKNFNLDKVMQGELQPIVASLLEMDKRERLEAV